MLKPRETTLGDVTVNLRCEHHASWPPAHAYLDEPLESQRARGFITEEKYQQILVWKRVCEKREMDEGCLWCPHAQMSGRRNWTSFQDSNQFKALCIQFPNQAKEHGF